MCFLSILDLPLQTFRAAEAHLLRATSERSYYRTSVKESKDTVHEFYTVDDVFSPPPAGTAVASGVGPQPVHYSFDFAQQVHYPHNPLQPVPSISRPRGSAPSLVCVVMLFPGSCITSSTKPVTWERVPTQSSASSTTSFTTMVLERASWPSMQTTAQGKTRITRYSRYRL